MEKFDQACKTLMGKFKSIIPEGSHRCRIRATSRETRAPREGTLADTIGDEPRGMVVVDCQGFPMKYDQMAVMETVVARQTCRIEVDVPREGGGWRRTHSSLETQDQPELDENWRRGLATGARYTLQQTWDLAEVTSTPMVRKTDGQKERST